MTAGARARRRAFATLLALGILNHAALTGARVDVALDALARGASPATVGLLTALFALLPMLSAVAIGRYSDRVGARAPMIAGSAGLAAATLLPAIAPGFLSLYAAALLIGFSFTVFQVALQHVTGEMGEPAKRVKRFSLLALAFSVSGILGPFAAGFAIDHFGHRATFALLAALPVVPLAILATRRVPIPPPVAHAARAKESRSLDLMRHPSMRRLLAINALFALGWDLHTVFVPIYGAQLGLSASRIGTVLAVFGVATFAVRVAMPWVAARATETQVLAGALFYTAAGTGVAGVQLLERPESIAQDGFALAFLGGLAVILLLGAYGLAGATAALTHTEGNRATPLRLVTLVGALLGFGLIALATQAPGMVATDIAVGSLLVIAILGVPIGISLVEPDRLGRRVAAQLPPTGVSLLLSPLLPGGRRAQSFGALLLVGAAALSNVMVALRDTALDKPGLYTGPWLAVAYGAIYLLLPAMALRRWMGRPGVRWLALFCMPGLVMFSTVVPMILGIFVNSYALREGHHIGNPIWTVAECLRNPTPPDGSSMVEIVALLLLLLNLPRIVEGYLEVIRACERRNARAS